MTTVRSDGELLTAWGAGDRGAGEELLARHFEAVVRFFHNKIERDHDDLIQKTFLGCLEGRAQYRGDGSFRAFLFGVAKNVLGKHLRQRYHEPAALDLAHVSVAELGHSPSLLVAEDQQQELMLHALRRIPIDHQIVLELHYWEFSNPGDPNPATRRAFGSNSTGSHGVRHWLPVLPSAPACAR